MKIAILSSASAGGAGIAAFRIYESFKATTNHEVDFFDMHALGQVDLEVSPTNSATNGKITNTHFTIDYAGDIRDWVIDLLAKYDVVNIQWSSYLISLAEIHELAKRGKNILFTLHDFHYITGGCHYPAGCLGYLKNCVGCPQVNEKLFSQQAVIATNKLKRSIFSYPNVHLSAPSAFIVKSALNSGIVPKERAHMLRNAYQPICDFESQKDTDVKSFLLIADSFDEQRKGLALAVDSLKMASESFRQKNVKVTLHLVGGLDVEVLTRLDGSGINVIRHGHIKEHERLVEIFKQCQFILSCSYEDNWPNILVESGSYGCVPIVGKWHGCEEFVSTMGVGYTSNCYAAIDFSYAIALAVNSEPASFDLKLYVNKVRSMHAPAKVVAAYQDVIDGTQKHNVEHENLQLGDNTYVSINHLVSLYTLSSKKNNHIQVVMLETPFGKQELLTKQFQFASFDQVLNFIKKNSSSMNKNIDTYGLNQLNLLDASQLNETN